MEVTINILLLIFFIFLPPTLSKGERYNVINFGAKPNSETDSSDAISSAWKAACHVATNSLVPPTIYVPKGRYLIGNALVFSGHNCKPILKNKGIILRIEGTLVAPVDYMVLGNAMNWLSFESVAGVTISGGSLDGQGTSLWACKANGNSNCPTGTTNLAFKNSKDILDNLFFWQNLAFKNSKDIIINGLRSLNSQLFHIVINGCDNVQVQGLKILALGKSPNTDGIHVQQSNNVVIRHSKIGTGDDCVSIGAGTINLMIYNVICGPGHGISIGSLAKNLNEPGVQNVTVADVVFKGTQNGVRIKSWGRPSNGFVKNVLFKGITMNHVQNPIIIDQNYCPNNRDCPGQVSGIKISDIIYEDIHGSSATEVAVKFDCSPKYRCTNIKMANVKLTYKKQLATSSCSNAGGTVTGIVEPTSCIIETTKLKFTGNNSL